ncbi:MAG: ATP-binding protein [Pseudomonadota bacterium]
MNTIRISTQEQATEREKTAKEIFAELNNFTDLEPTLVTVIGKIKEISKCESVGLRLHDKGDYPYYTHDGFSDKFIRNENSLCSKDKDGNRIPVGDSGSYLLDCMCGNVISGKTDPAFPFFTTGGSFWSNHTTKLLKTTTEEDLQSRTRNYCNASGYESVALVPIKARGERIGLIQMNDKRTGMFEIALIQFVEMIGEHIGVAVQNALIHENLKQTKEELARSNKELEVFASVAAHDLQEPLRKIRIFGQLLKKEGKDASQEDIFDYVERMAQAAGRMQELIDDLLRYSRVMSEVASFYTVNLQSVLDRVVEDLEVKIKETNARVESEGLGTIDGVPTQIYQLFQNLLSNSLKFHRRDEPPVVKVIGKTESNICTILIEDNGIGFDEKYKKRIFGVFQRLHGRGDYEGTGMGLAICEKIVERHNGEITVTSRQGHGTRFAINLPTKQSKQREQHLLGGWRP